MYGGSFEGSRRSGFIQTDFLEGSHIDQSTIHGPNHFLEGSHIDPATSYGPDRFLEGSHTDGNTSHGPNYPVCSISHLPLNSMLKVFTLQSHNHLAQFSPTSIHSISSNPAPIGEGTWGTTHQPFLGPTLSYPHTEPYAGVRPTYFSSLSTVDLCCHSVGHDTLAAEPGVRFLRAFPTTIDCHSFSSLPKRHPTTGSPYFVWLIFR